MKKILGLCLVLILLIWGGEAQAGQLANRLAQFPDWEGKPPVTTSEGDLIYPEWMEGTWKVSSTLVDQVAPLAPDLVTPGFKSNRRYLNQPVTFLVRFQAVNDSPMQSAQVSPTVISDRFLPLKPQSEYKTNSGQTPMYRPDGTPAVVADRAFNGLNIAKAYLGEARVQSVKVDPDSPNRQITTLPQGRQLISVVTGRASETPTPDRFIATEVSNQIFRGTPQPYFNQVETTTAYQLLPETLRASDSSQDSFASLREVREQSQRKSPSLAIEADQVTAVYLSPQDPDYFKALDRPVALYRYRLELRSIKSDE